MFRNSIETFRSRDGGNSDSVRNELFDEKELKFVSIPTCILHQFSPVFFHHLAEKTRLAALQKARQDSINQAAVAEKARKVQAEAQAKAAAEADRST